MVVDELEQRQEQPSVAEAGYTMTDLFWPYLMCPPALRVVWKLRPHGSAPLPADYWSECQVTMVAASYGFSDENVMILSC